MFSLLLAFFIYFGALIAFGLYFYKKNKNEGSFLLANRSLNYWVTAISAQSSDMGSWLFLGFPAVVYATGLVEAWTAIGLVVFMYLNWTLIAPRLRDMTEKYHALTIPSFLYKRFDNKKIKIVGALISIFFFTCYLSSGLVGLGRLFESSFGMNYYIGIIIATAVTMIYILVGGYFAVAWSNLFQGLFLLAVIIIVPGVALIKVGGFAAVKAALLAKNISLSLIPQNKSLIEVIILALGWGLGYFGQPHILVNFMSIKNSNQITKARSVGIIWQLLVLISAIGIGIVGVAYFQNVSINPEHIFVTMAKELFHPIICGFAMCGILAAVLSTLNSQLLVASGSVAEDLLPEFKPSATQKDKYFAAHVSIVAIALFAMILSFFKNDSIYKLVLYAWSGLGATFGPAIIHALYAKKISPTGVLYGMIAGATTSAMWPMLGTNIPALIPAFAINYAIICAMRFFKK